MANLKDLIVRGVSRFIGKVYVSDIQADGSIIATNISDAAGKGVSTAVASSDANLITSGAVYTALGGAGVVSTYASTGTTAVNGKAILAAIQGLDVSDTAVANQYVTRVSEVDGKISVTRSTLPTQLPASNTTSTYSSTGTSPVNGTAVAAAIGGLDVSDTAVANQYVSRISQVDGKISVTRATLPTSLPASDTVSTYSSTGTAPVNGKAVLAALQGLDVSDTAVANQYVTRVSEVDGKISVTRSTFPTGTSSVSGLVKLGATGGAATYEHTHTSYATSTESDGVADAAYMLYDFDTGTNVSAGDAYTPVYFSNAYNTPQSVTYSMPIPYVTTDSGSTRTAMTATISGVTSYADGLTIRVKCTVTSGTNTNCTLNVNGLGALPIYLNTGNTRVTTHWAQNAIYDLVYDTTYVSTGAWIMMGGYNTNSNTYDRTLHNNSIKAAAAVTAAHIIVGTSDGYKQLAADVEFDFSYLILYASAKITSGSTSTGAYDLMPSVNFSTSGTIENGAGNKVIYLKVTQSSTALERYKIAAAPFLTCTPTDSSCYYIPLGLLANGSATTGYFFPQNQVYGFDTTQNPAILVPIGRLAQTMTRTVNNTGSMYIVGASTQADNAQTYTNTNFRYIGGLYSASPTVDNQFSVINQDSTRIAIYSLTTTDLVGYSPYIIAEASAGITLSAGSNKIDINKTGAKGVTYTNSSNEISLTQVIDENVTVGNGAIHFYRVGNIVFAYGYLRGSYAVGRTNLTPLIPAGFRPVIDMSTYPAKCINTNGSSITNTTFATMDLKTTGAMSLYAAAAYDANWYYPLTITYITNEPYPSS